MKLELYQDIIHTLNTIKMEKCLDVLKERFKTVAEDALISIYGQFYQNKVKKVCYKHIRNGEKYYRRYCISAYQREAKGFLYRHALDIDYPPSLYARIILEQFYKKDSDNVSKKFISTLLKEPNLIEDPYLAEEIKICVVEDNIYGTLAIKMKAESGLKYEKIIADFLHKANIPYAEEDVLRKEGYDKTPDFKLILPIGVDNHVINWIECKALFGTTESHNDYLEHQFWSYTNRFGPGLVVYWFGFVDELDVNVERGILLMDHLPKNIITLESLLDEKERDFQLVF